MGGGVRVERKPYSLLEGGYPRVRKMGRERGHPGETMGAGIADLAYKGLGDVAPQNSRALSTAPITCYAICVINGCCNEFHFISFPQCTRSAAAALQDRASVRPRSSELQAAPLPFLRLWPVRPGGVYENTGGGCFSARSPPRSASAATSPPDLSLA